MGVCFGSHHAAHEPHSFLGDFFAKEIVSGDGLTPRTASAARMVGQRQDHSLKQSGTRLQIMQGFQLTASSILDESTLPRGYL